MKLKITKTKLFFVFTSVFLSNGISGYCQSLKQDSLKNARQSTAQSINGNVTYDGTGAGTAGNEGSYFGYYSGSSTTGQWNTFVGSYSGNSNTTGERNVFIGSSSGRSNTTGKFNAFIGYASGYNNATGTHNVFAGLSAGNDNTSGSHNTFLGFGAANSVTTGSTNVSIGSFSGNSNIVGTGNVFLGYRSGYKELGSNKLYIANDSTSSPLIYGDFSNKKLVFNGKTGIGTSTFPTNVGSADVSNYKLFVKGGILADEVRIRTGWADYVFEQNYKLAELYDVEKFIKLNGHLPNIPSASEVEKQGLSIGEISKLQQEKIEELTLYIIELKKTRDLDSVKMEVLKSELQDIKSLVNNLVEQKNIKQ